MYRWHYPELARLRKTAWPWSFYDALHLECWVYRSLCGKQTMTDASNYPMYIDRRDAAVVEQLTEGAEYGVTHIKRLYKIHTDIRQDSTAKQRKDNLVKSPAFTNTGIGRFIFTGVEIND